MAQHSNHLGDYTFGEVKALIAPIVGIPAEDIDSFVIITEGLCSDCGNRHGIIEIDNCDDGSDVGRIMFGGLSARTHREED